MKTLNKLAKFYGIQTKYRSAFGTMVLSPADSIAEALRAMGVELRDYKNEKEVLLHLRNRIIELNKRTVEPVLVAWNGELRGFEITLPEGEEPDCIELYIELEGGGAVKRAIERQEMRVLKRGLYGVEGFRKIKIYCIVNLPYGYHKITITTNNCERTARLISAPIKAYQPNGKVWGLFAPIYSLRSNNDMGIGSFIDLLRLAEKVNALGGSIVGTLPIYPTSIYIDGEYSPYKPMSRVFLNEIYVDLNRLDVIQDLENKELLAADIRNFVKEKLQSPENMKSVYYNKVAENKRQIIEKILLKYLLPNGIFGDGQGSVLERFILEHPLAREYAEYMAALELEKNFRSSNSICTTVKFSPPFLYYVSGQYLAFRQLEWVKRRMKEMGVMLYLDLPIGIHIRSFDLHRYKGIYSEKATIGAPPDPVFADGQDWGLPAPLPDKLRESLYAPFVEAVRFAMRFADVLRIDHAMGLHRLYWIPRGKKPTEGVYVRYRAEEMYAILSLESHRNKTVVVAENLGTVPSYVNRSLRKHGILEMYVLQYEAYSKKIRKPPKYSLASLNTHDMPPFLGFITGEDLVERGDVSKRSLQLRREAVMRLLKTLKVRRSTPNLERDLITNAIRHLAASDAILFVIGVDDLLLERTPHNIPATDRPMNWRKRYPKAIDEIFSDAEVLNTLREVTELRRCKKQR